VPENRAKNLSGLHDFLGLNSLGIPPFEPDNALPGLSVFDEQSMDVLLQMQEPADALGELDNAENILNSFPEGTSNVIKLRIEQRRPERFFPGSELEMISGARNP